MATATLTSRKSRKQEKPYPDFPLTPKTDGRWQKKCRGKTYTFAGSWREALDQWNEIDAALRDGKTPSVDEPTIRDAIHKFLTVKKNRVATEELSERSLRDYKATCRTVADHFGLSRTLASLNDDAFEEFRAALAKTRKLSTLGNEITRVRVLFKSAIDSGLVKHIDGLPNFKKPVKKTLDKEKNADKLKYGEKVFTIDEVRTMLEHADPTMKAMLLLGVTNGLGNNDIALLERGHVKGDKLWFPRPKTGADRESLLLPETLQAIEDAGGLPFRTENGNLYVTSTKNTICKMFPRLMDACGIPRNRRGFYTLRHTCRTVLDETLDVVAIDLLMGHKTPGIGAQVYNHRVGEERLRRLAEHLRKWLFGV